MNEKQGKIVNLRDIKLKNERLAKEKAFFESKSSEMHPDDWQLKMESIKIEILKARGDIFKIEEDLGIDRNDSESKKLEEEAYREIEEIEKEYEKIIVSDSLEDQEFFDEVSKIVNEMNSISDRIIAKGYTLENFEDLEGSDNPEDASFYNEIVLEFEGLKIKDRIDLLKTKNPNLLIDILIPNLKESFFRSFILEDISDEEMIHHSKIVDSYIKNIPKGIDLNKEWLLKRSIDLRLINEKRKTLINLPIDEILELITNEPSLLKEDNINLIKNKTIKLCESYMANKDFGNLKIFIDKLKYITSVNGDNYVFDDFLPKIAEGVSFNNQDTVDIFTGNMPKGVFDRYYTQIASGFFMNLVPEIFLKEKSFHEEFIKDEFVSIESINKILNKSGLSFKDLSPEEKSYLLKKGGEKIISLYSVDDFDQILKQGTLDIELIPSEYYPNFKDVILSNYFDLNKNLSFDNLNNFFDKTKFSISDLDNDQKIKLLHSIDLKMISLFEPKDLKDFLLNDKSNIDFYNMKEILDHAGITIHDLPDDYIIKLLNNRNYSKDFISYFTPTELKKLILSENSNVYNFLDLDYLLEFSGVKVSDFSYNKKEKLFHNFINDSEIIKKYFTVEDIREIVLKDSGYINIFKEIPMEYIDDLTDEILTRYLKGSRRYQFISNKKERNWVLNKLREKNKITDELDNENSMYEKQQKIQRIKRIQESFYFIDDQEKLPQEVLEKFNIFKEKYGKKGEGIMSLAVVAYGLEDLNQLINNIEDIENILDLYNEEKIPEGCRVTQGIEYEVGDLMGKEFDKISSMGYVTEAEFVGISAGIKRGGAGSGAIYEHATKPTDNPYMLMIEMQLMQDAGFIDLNYKEFENGSRGYHSNIGGETGLSASSNDMNFLHNTMTLASLSGMNLGVEINSTKTIYQKSLEDGIFKKRQGGDRVEIKGMGCDSIEQFNKSVITIHNSCIAVQVLNKYLNNSDELLDKLPDDVDSFDKFIEENNLYKDGSRFNTNQEKEIVYTWLRFKKDIFLSIRQHNNSFIDSEFKGFFIDERGNGIDTAENIDLRLNKDIFTNNKLDYNDKEKLNKLYRFDEEDLFNPQSTKLLQTLGHINNTFVFKEPILNKNKLYQDDISKKWHVKRMFMANAYSTLTRMNSKGYVKDIPGSPFDSIVETKGKIRDGYYHFQGASEEMISHKSQILLNEFNNKMRELLTDDTLDSEVLNEDIKQYERAI